MNKKRKEKMEDDSSGSFSRNKLILPEKYEATLSFVQMNDAAWTLLHMKRQRLCSSFANKLQELMIDKNNNETCVVRPKVRTSFPKESRTANHLQELIDKNNNQTCVVPPQVLASFLKESRAANHLQELIVKNNNQTCVVPPEVLASFPKESRTANHLQELIGKNNNNQTCVIPPEVLASFPEESLRHLVGQYSSCLTKELTISDIRSNQMRLMFPKNFVEKDINPLLKDGESPKRGIPTTLYFVNPKTKQNRYNFPMTYKSWGEDKTHVLTSGWLILVNECKIDVGETIKLWVFRHSRSGDLCFAATMRLPDGRL